MTTTRIPAWLDLDTGCPYDDNGGAVRPDPTEEQVRTISDAGIAAMRTGHFERSWHRCFECGHGWPCPTARLIARLDASEAEVERLRELNERFRRALTSGNEIVDGNEVRFLLLDVDAVAAALAPTTTTEEP